MPSSFGPIVPLDFPHALQLAVLHQQLLEETETPNEKNLVQLEIEAKTWLSHDYGVIGLFESGLLAGFCLYEEAEQYISLKKLFVGEDFRRQTIGSQLIEYLKTEISKPIRLAPHLITEEAELFFRYHKLDNQ
jgi:GNAT superfamily N-acetyltransferase